MLYGLATVKKGVIFKSKSLELILEQMNNYSDAYIVEIEEETKPKRNFSEEFYELR